MERKYFSGFEQDKWVVEEIFNFQENRYFVDLAAADGIKVSNTYYLEKYLNWKGICIEANDKIFKKLKENRTCICEHACVDGKSQKVKFTCDDSITPENQWKIYNSGIIDKDVDNKEEENEKFIWKQTVTLEEILKKHNTPKIIDFLSLDIEGAETRVMKEFPFNKYTFLSLCVERPGRLLRSIFRKNGYLEVGFNSYDRLYIHKILFRTFNAKKKWKIYHLYNLRNSMRILKFDRMIYYLIHFLEIPGMVRRKLAQFK